MSKWIICLLILLAEINASGQKMLDMKYYISNPQISKNAKDFYTKKLRPTDDALTESIVDSLKTKNDLTRPFYIYLTSTMLEHSDGGLGELLLPSCKEFLEESPDHLIEFLYSPDNQNRTYCFDWAMIISNDFSMACDGTERKCITESMNKTMLKTKTKNKKNLTVLYDRIQKYANAR